MSLVLRVLKWFESVLPKVTITVKGTPYLTRCYLFGKDRRWGNVYLHHFHSSDQGVEMHNHPWAWGLSVVLWGGYVEERSRNPVTWEMKKVDTPLSMLPNSRISHIGMPATPVFVQERIVPALSVNLIKSTDFHRVDLCDAKEGAWSIFIAGPRVKSWGFLNRYTSEYTDWRNNPEAIE